MGRSGGQNGRYYRQFQRPSLVVYRSISVFLILKSTSYFLRFSTLSTCIPLCIFQALKANITHHHRIARPLLFGCDVTTAAEKGLKAAGPRDMGRLYIYRFMTGMELLNKELLILNIMAPKHTYLTTKLWAYVKVVV